MHSLPFAHGPFLLIQIGNYLLALVCLGYTWTKERSLTALMLAGMSFGYAVEYSAVTHSTSYYYTEAVLTLPGKVPLGIVLSWGLILLAIYQVVPLLGIGRLRQALAAGLLAVALDFVTDPAFVSLGFWVWKLPQQWFGIPWNNYVGWFLIVTGFIGILELVHHRWPPAGRPFWQQLLLSLMPIIPACAVFVGGNVAYKAIVGAKIPGLTEARLVSLIFGAAAVVVLLGLPSARRGEALRPLALVVPGYLLACSLLVLYLTSLSAVSQELVIVFPIFALVVLVGFSWPFLDQLFDRPSNKS